MHPFFVALQFLTRLPVPNGDPKAADVSQSLLYYPLVGLLVGLLLAAGAWLLADAPPALAAALLLVAWVALTGALHLDGLADSADAWVGGLGDRGRTLEIMKDPRTGPMGAVALICVLLVKFAALQALLTQDAWISLILVPTLARAALPALLLTTPYVRPGGLGEPLAGAGMNPAAAVLAVTAGGGVALGGLTGLWLLVVGTVVYLLVRRAMVRRIGGTTGDTAGAMVEILETATLVAAAMA